MSTRIIQGDCRDVLKTLPDASVQMILTSPPYYKLRTNGMVAQVGMEDTVAGYIANLVEILHESRRILKSSGVLFLNLGDTYHDKQRLMVPARVALALQADGWILRDEIVWHKPRTTPAPVVDRTVAAHEMIYLLAKERRYFFDFLAIEEPAAYAGLVRKAGQAFRDLVLADPNAARKRPGVDREIVVRETRRKRSVWSVSPSPYKDGHFRTMPPDIAETCILAGSRPGDTVLDMFAGAFTTAIVANRLQRDTIGIELNQAYIDLSRDRLTKDAGLFAQIKTDNEASIQAAASTHPPHPSEQTERDDIACSDAEVAAP